MSETEISDRIAGLFAQVWRNHRQPMFQTYLAISFLKSVSQQPSFDAISIVEWPEGDVERGQMHTYDATRSWLVDAEGFRFVEWKELPKYVPDHNSAIDEERTFFKYPLLNFHRRGSRLLLGEKYGPNLACRKRGELVWDGDELSILDME